MPCWLEAEVARAYRIPRPVPIRTWVWDSRGREAITPTDVDCDHKALHQLVAESGLARTFEFLKLPDFWPFDGDASSHRTL